MGVRVTHHKGKESFEMFQMLCYSEKMKKCYAATTIETPKENALWQQCNGRKKSRDMNQVVSMTSPPEEIVLPSLSGERALPGDDSLLGEVVLLEGRALLKERALPRVRSLSREGALLKEAEAEAGLEPIWSLPSSPTKKSHP